LADAACARFAAARGAWVEEGHALDLQFDGAVPAADGWEGVDLLPVTPGPRIRRLLIADMDSTMIGQECIDELADYAGVKPEVAAITERAMQGELDFAGALRARVALLEGLDEAVIAQCLAERVRPNPGADTLIATMRKFGATCLLVSGGFTAFAEPVGKMLGFDEVRANRLTVRDGEQRDDGAGRRRQRQGDGRSGGMGGCLPRQASAGGGRRCAARPSWTRRAAVGAGNSARAVDRGLAGRRHDEAGLSPPRQRGAGGGGAAA